MTIINTLVKLPNKLTTKRNQKENKQQTDYALTCCIRTCCCLLSMFYVSFQSFHTRNSLHSRVSINNTTKILVCWLILLPLDIAEYLRYWRSVDDRRLITVIDQWPIKCTVQYSKLQNSQWKYSFLQYCNLRWGGNIYSIVLYSALQYSYTVQYYRLDNVQHKYCTRNSKMWGWNVLIIW